MTSTPRQPLDAQERELADRLAQLGAPVEPSAAVDARILAAARAATRMEGAATTTGAGRSRRRRRWPVAMGVAATLALAVGIAWQLRPVEETRQAYSEAPVAMVVRDAPAERPPLRRLPATEVDAAAPPPSPPIPAMEPPPAPAEAPRKRAEAATAADEDAGAKAASGSGARTDERRRSDAAAELLAEPEARLLRDAADEAEQASAAVPSAFPATDDAGSAERKAVRQGMQKPAPEIVLDTVAPAPPAPPPPPATSAPQQREPDKAAAPVPATTRESLDRIEVTGSRIGRDNDGFSDQAIDDQPPATADSPLVQQAWLQRIRELIAKARIDAAHTSLDEFKRRYPRYALPDDLRAFQEGKRVQAADAVPGAGQDAAEDDPDDAVDADGTEGDGGDAPDASQDASDQGGFER